MEIAEDLIWNAELSGEAIMLARDHLSEVGIGSSFLDDAAMVAKCRIRALRRALRAAGVDPDSVAIEDEDVAAQPEPEWHDMRPKPRRAA